MITLAPRDLEADAGEPVPLAMFAITARALLWAWAVSGVEVELATIVLPRARPLLLGRGCECRAKARPCWLRSPILQFAVESVKEVARSHLKLFNADTPDAIDGVYSSVTAADEKLVVQFALLHLQGTKAYGLDRADPNTDWLAGSDVALDTKGFVLTGEDAGGDRHELETSRRGVFAIGDVRSKSIKRVAAAVGEGAQVVAALHSYLATIKSVPNAEISPNDKIV
jgi:hypothetical protein